MFVLFFGGIMEIGEIIAYNLKRLREERNLSLGQLAELAGVSKVMLSQLEKGSSNPTINTVWKITGALHEPYTSLLELPQDHAIHIHKQEIQPLVEGKYHIFNYYPKDGDRNFELYQIELEPGCVHESIGHSIDGNEYVMMVEGCMELEVRGKVHVLAPDDGFCFNASVPHVYRNRETAAAKAVLMIFYT